MVDGNLIGAAGPTLLDAYEAGKEILRSSGTNKQLARRLVELSGSADVGIFMRLLKGDFTPSNDGDLREIASIVRVPRWFTEPQKANDATSQIEKYFTEIGKQITVTDLRVAYDRMERRF